MLNFRTRPITKPERLTCAQCCWLVGVIAKHKLGRHSLFGTTKTAGLSFSYGNPSGTTAAGLGYDLSLLLTPPSLNLWSAANCVIRSFGNPKAFVTRLMSLLDLKPSVTTRGPSIKLFGIFGYNSVRFEARTRSTIPQPDAIRVPEASLLINKERLCSTGSDTWCSTCFCLSPCAFRRTKRQVRWLVKAAYSIDTELPVTAPTDSPTDNALVPQGSAFVRSAHQVINRIRTGDIMQLQMSRRFWFANESRLTIRLLEVMCRINPSPFTFRFCFSYYKTIGTSPETLICTSHTGFRLSSIKPIAGTRPRGKTIVQDAKLKDELKGNPKEVAEHIMLVDLARNDLNKAEGTSCVTVGKPLVVEQFSHVQHIVSTVRSKVTGTLNCLEIVWCSFPAGTVSGAPKQKAVSLIDVRERMTRSCYGGAVGSLSTKGANLAIAIRSVVVVGQSLHTQSAAGIVNDSILTDELRETDNKVMVALSALRDTSKGTVWF